MAGADVKLSWGAAIYMMWRGKAVMLGGGHKWKSLSVVLAFILTLSMPAVRYFDVQNFSGAIPPEAPLLKASGVFVSPVDRVGLKNTSYFVFSADEGRGYLTENRVAPGVMKELASKVPGVKVEVEGFVLKDGKGSFYPLRIIGAGGVELTPPGELMARLMIWRDYFYYKWVVFYLSLISFFWAISFFYAYKLRRMSGG